MEQFRNKRLIYFGFFSFILILYLLFLSRNNSGDAWSYAADAKFGNELFSPHHLLYTATLYILKLCTGYENTLALGMILNAVFAMLCCIVLFQILKIISNNPLRALILTAMAAFSFGFWRFATENENYIIPIFFSLMGSFFFVKSYVKQIFSSKYIIWSGIFATIACLYHQIHIFWFIGLLVGWVWMDDKPSLKRGLLFASTFLIAPLTYFLVIVFYLHQSLTFYSITHFVLHDYYTGGAGNYIGFNNFLLGSISFIRAFFQVHGQIGVMVLNNRLWLIPGFLAILLLVIATMLVFRNRKNHNANEIMPGPDIVYKTHLLIFILQLAFAVYNIGNAEFMAMLPVLLAILIVKADWVPVKSLVFISISLFIWNFSYGIYPNNRLHFNADNRVTQFIIDHPKDKFIAAQPAIVLNQYYYQKGYLPNNVWPAPEYYQVHAPVSQLKARIDSALSKGGNVYTDCNGRSQITSRESMLKGESDFFKSYNLKDTVAVFETEAGKHVIFKVNR